MISANAAGGLVTPLATPLTPGGSADHGGSLTPLPRSLEAHVNASLNALPHNQQMQEYGWAEGDWTDASASASAMIPSTEDYAMITDVFSLCEWAGVPSEQDEQDNSILRSLLDFLGMPPQQHFRAFAQVSAADFTAELSSWKLEGDRSPGLIVKGAAELAHMTARRLCGLDPWPDNQAEVAALRQKLENAESQAQASIGKAPPVVIAAPMAGTGGRLVNTPIIKLCQVLDQKLDSEITFMTDDEQQAALEIYIKVMEIAPHPDITPTPDQLSAIHYIMSQKRAPYADMSVYGPHGQRALRRQKLTGKQFDSDGNLITVELYGPCNLTAWLASYAVLGTSLIMLKAVKRAHLDAYREFIIELHNTFGDRYWVLLYQADVRMRQEWMDACRRGLIGQHQQMISMGGYTSFDPEQPWDMVWTEAVKADKFWQKEF